MTIPLAEPHVTAVWEQLQADLTIPVGLAEAPVGVPCVAIYPDAGDVAQARLCGDRSSMTIRFTVHGIGSGPQQAAWAQDQVRLSLLGTVPAVAGRKVSKFVQEYAPPVLRDDDVKPTLYVQAAEYRLFSQPA